MFGQRLELNKLGNSAAELLVLSSAHVITVTFNSFIHSWNKINQVAIKVLTQKAQNEHESHSILVEAEVDWLRIQNGADQVSLGCEKPWGWERRQKTGFYF